MTSGERRLAERLEQKLDDDYLLWYGVPMGPRSSRAEALPQRKSPFSLPKRSGDYNPSADNIQIMTMKVSKCLEFPVVVLPGVGHMPAAGEDEQEAARVFYVAATRATQRLVIGVGGDGGFGSRLGS
jgi:superfamily I DNA/RNA helicase